MSPAPGWRYGNGWYSPQNGWVGAFREFPLAQVSHQSTWALVGDSQYWFIAAGTAGTRHRGGKANLVFCDGHVAALGTADQGLAMTDPAKLN